MRNVFYLFDTNKRNQLNAAGQDYTPAYIRALLKYMGISGTACAPEALGMLGKDDVLLIGAESIDAVPDGPGAVIMLGTRIGAPLTPAAKRPHICGWYPVKESNSKTTVLLPLFAPVEEPQAGTTEVLTTGYTGEVRPEGKPKEPLLVKRGDNVWHFLFDLPASVWYSGDGDPLGAPVFEFPIGRTPDTRPVPADYDTTIPYNDLLVGELERILDKLEVPSLYKLPPAADGGVPDLALHISGDDDHASAELDLRAAQVARAIGLPYHINVMSAGGKFVIDREQLAKLRELGTEVALHSNFLEYPYTAEGQKQMADIFTEELGLAPVTNVNHCLVQGGPSAERMRWLAFSGIVADNGKFCERDLTDINAFDLMGFGFGTSFPRYTCDDAAHGNEMLTAFEIPLTYYEPRCSGEEGSGEKITKYIDAAAAHGRIAQFFIHPHYLHPDDPRSELSTAALRLAKKHWTDKGYTPLLTTTNRLALFWQSRARAVLTSKAPGLVVETACPLLVNIPGPARSVLLDGEKVKLTEKTVAGRKLRLLEVKEGRHIITNGKGKKAKGK